MGAEEEIMDLYDALLELIECADGIDDEGVVNLTDTNAHLFDFLDLLRHPEPIPEEYLALEGTPPRRGKPSAAPESETEEPVRPRVLAFPGVTLDEGGKEADGEIPDDDDDDDDDLDVDDFINNSDLPDDIIAALEEFRATGKLSDALNGDDESLFVDDDLMVRMIWPEAVHLAFSLNEYLGWSASARDAAWAREIRWRPAYGTVLRFQAQLIDCICDALPGKQADQARELLRSPKVSVKDICFQYIDLLNEEFVLATAKRRKAMLGPVIAEIAKSGPRNEKIRKEAEAKARELDCPVEEISFTGEMPDDLEW